MKAKALSVPISQINSALNVYMGSAYINDFNYNNRSYRVYVQARQSARMTPGDLRKFYVRSDTGQMVTLDNLVTIAQHPGLRLLAITISSGRRKLMALLLLVTARVRAWPTWKLWPRRT